VDSFFDWLTDRNHYGAISKDDLILNWYTFKWGVDSQCPLDKIGFFDRSNPKSKIIGII
jgi:hypothetical protein